MPKPRRVTPEYMAWQHMKNRCLNPRDPKFHRYGGRGITVHAPWVSSFSLFSDHIGPRPTEKHTLDRIDVNRGYEPGNVRWATQKTQQNNRTNTRIVIVDGET